MAEVTEAPKKTEVTQGQGSEVKVAHPAATLMPWTESTFALMRRFSEEMDRLFEDFGFGRRLQTAFGRGRELLRREVGLIPAEWSPRIDVLEREGQYIVRADLPGMTKDDIKVEVTDEMITIQGERKQEKEEKREGYYYGERAYGSYYRAIPLPEGADHAKATAEFHNGVLEITMPAPKKPEKKSRLLEIQEKK
ncbi:MAG: Hsp20/alpha crystallin family protein [Isosphaeraceae bacterium]